MGPDERRWGNTGQDLEGQGSRGKGEVDNTSTHANSGLVREESCPQMGPDERRWGNTGQDLEGQGSRGKGEVDTTISHANSGLVRVPTALAVLPTNRPVSFSELANHPSDSES